MEHYIERQIREAIERGDFESPQFAGKPIDDLDEQKQPGWWAEKWARRELTRDEDSDPMAEMLRIWRAQRRHT